VNVCFREWLRSRPMAGLGRKPPQCYAGKNVRFDISIAQSCRSGVGPPKSRLLGAHFRLVPASAVVLESGRHVGSRFRLPWVESGSSRHDGGSTGNDPYLTSRDGLARPSRIFRSSSWLCDLSFKDEQVALRGLRCKQPGFLISRILVAGFGHLV